MSAKTESTSGGSAGGRAAARCGRRSSAGGEDLVAPGFVVREDAGVEVAERELHRAGERRQVEHVRRALLPRVPERVGEHEPALGVGVDDLDRLAVGGREDVAGPERVAARHVLRRGDDGEHAHREAELGDRADALDHGGAAGHVALHVLHVQRRLERDAAGVERDRLADEAEHDGAARAGRVVAQDDQARRVVAALRDRGERAHPELARSASRSSASAVSPRARRDLLRAVGEPFRGEVVRRRLTRSRARFAHSATIAARCGRARGRRRRRRGPARAELAAPARPVSSGAVS